MQVPFATHSYRSRSLPLSAQDLINYYAEAAVPNAKSFVVLHGTPGLKLFTTAGTGPCRGMHRMAGVLYVVSAARLYSVDSGGVVTDRGNIPGFDRVDMADNGTQLVIVSPNDGYVYDNTTQTLEQITDPDFPGAGSVEFLDGYFVFSEPGSGRFFLSALFDGKNYDALDFATAEGAPDDTIEVFVDHRELFVLGQKTIEVWFNSGASPFPLERAPGGFIEQGIHNAGAIAKMDNSIIWLGDDLIVYRAVGFTPVRVSTHAVEFAIAGYTNRNAEAFTYTQEGHKFFVLNFAEGTWVYDGTTGLWHRRLSFQKTRSRVHHHVPIYDKLLVGDFETGNIGELDLDTYDEYDTTLRAEATSLPLGDETRELVMASFQLVMETGVGLTTGQGSDPQAMLQVSDDGGRTWSSEMWESIGKKGEYQTEVKWNRLGGFRSRVMRVAISDPVKRAIYSAHVEPNVPLNVPQLEAPTSTGSLRRAA